MISQPQLLGEIKDFEDKSSPPWGAAKRRMSCRGLIVARQLILFSLGSMGWPLRSVWAPLP